MDNINPTPLNSQEANHAHAVVSQQPQPPVSSQQVQQQAAQVQQQAQQLSTRAQQIQRVEKIKQAQQAQAAANVPSSPSTAAPQTEPSAGNRPQIRNETDTVSVLDALQTLAVNATADQRLVDEERNSLEEKIKSGRVMIVDDEEANVMMVRQYLLRSGYQNFVTTTDSRRALDIAGSELPDLILLDIKMPHVNGLEILRVLSLNSKLKNIPVIILTAASNPQVKKTALEMGANDFLTKPVDPNELVPRVRNALMLKTHFDKLASQKNKLEQLVKRRTDELYQSRQQIILSLARAAEHRDNETGNHVLRVGYYAAVIARQLGWKDKEVEMIQQAAQLHDVGKIGIPDSILFKPGKLDESEYDLMRTHCTLGKQIISPFEASDAQILRTHARLGESILHVRNSPLMMMAARIAQTHHEHWNGNGYPLGLAGEDIPIEGRITAVADVFDALSSKRPYKDPFPRQKCFDIMSEMRGSHFDPQVLDAFFECAQQIIEIQLAFVDE